MASPGQCLLSSFLIGLLSGNLTLIGLSCRGSVAMALNDDCLAPDATMNVRTVWLNWARCRVSKAPADWYQISKSGLPGHGCWLRISHAAHESRSAWEFHDECEGPLSDFPTRI
jgi:hypothetical protein